MVDIEAYKKYEQYMKFQNLRPDYTQAITQSIKLAKKYIEDKKEINIADFCCGTGINTKLLAKEVGGINKAILVDINEGFLNIASNSEINSKKLEILKEDILKAKFKKDNDLVLSIFAYHHVKNNDKLNYLKQVKSALKKGGILVLTEIYLKNKKLCLKYYAQLFNSIDKNKIINGLNKFLMQTAESNDFEFKVSKPFADKQLKEAGFVKIAEEKIYPLDDSMEKDQGTFVQIYQLV